MLDLIFQRHLVLMHYIDKLLLIQQMHQYIDENSLEWNYIRYNGLPYAYCTNHDQDEALETLLCPI